MTTLTRRPQETGTPGAVAVAGTDDWLGRRIAGHLAGTGLSVRHMGTGSSSLHHVDTLVIVPLLVPRSANAKRDVGLNTTGITLGAATLGRVDHVVLVSLVGADSNGPGHLGALGCLEARVLARGSRVTIVRATQVYGTPNDPGPLIERLHHALCLEPTRLPSLEIEPVFVGDVIATVEAAVYRRLPATTFEVAGPRHLEVNRFIELFVGHAEPGSATPAARRLMRRPFGGRGARALSDLLESQPVAIRRKAPLNLATNHKGDPLGKRGPAHDRIEVA